MKKLVTAVLSGLLLSCVFSAPAQDSWKSVKLPEGKNLFPNPTMQPRNAKMDSILDWGNNGGKKLKLSWVDTADGKILRVKSSGKGYHYGIARSQKLKPDTEYLCYVVCRGKFGSAPQSKVVTLYRHASLPGWKKPAVTGNSRGMNKDFPWTLFQGTIKTPDHTGPINTSFYLLLFYGDAEVDIACAGLIEKGPARTALPALDPKYKNLLLNPAFKNGPGNLPYNWNINFADGSREISSKDGVVTLKKIEPQKRAFQVSSGDSVVLRQGELILNPGKKYRISAWLKTEQLQAARSGLIVYNYAWNQAVGIEGLPENTNGWKKFEKEIILPKSKWNSYVFALYTVGTRNGLLHIKDAGLYPVDDEAAAGVRKAPAYNTLYKAVPVDPLLSEMDADTGKMTFSFDYVLPGGKESDYEGVVRFRQKGAKNFSSPKRFPLKDKKIHALLGKLPQGDGVLSVEVINRKSSARIGYDEYPVTVKKKFRPAWKAEKRLNMLTRRLLTARTGKSAQNKYLFSTPERTWVWIRLGNTPGKKSSVKLNGKALKGHLYTSAWETLRLLPAGNHTLEVTDYPAGTALIINSVPEVFIYSYPWVPGKVKFPAFRKDFYNKYIFPVITTVNHGYGTSEQVRQEYASYGKNWFSLGLHLHKLNVFEKPEDMAKRLHTARLKKNMHGLAFDEIFIGSVTDKWIYTQALQLLTKAPLPIYTWSSGVKFQVNGLNSAFFSATANNGGGTGKYLFECYARTQPDEKSADAYLEDFLNETMRRAEKLMPGAPRHSLIILGGYSRPGGYCTDTFAGPDVKKFWDKFFFRLANEKEFKDLYGVGLYSYYRGTEESLRWWNALIRHYCLEGNRESLAEKYNYTYMPGHIRNGDFTEQLKFWNAKAAPDGSVKAGKKPFFGRDFQGRKGYPPSTGENYCVFKRSAKGENTLSTKLTGLRKGAVYALRYTVTDQADVKAKKPSGKKLGLFARFSGAKDITETSAAGKYVAPDGVFVSHYVNCGTRVFRAEAPEVTLTFSDWKDAKTPGGPAGQELLLNMVRVTPYFSE